VTHKNDFVSYSAIDWKSARDSRGYSQREVAELAGITPSAYYHLEKGYNEPRLSTIVWVAGALNAEIVIRNGECTINLLE